MLRERHYNAACLLLSDREAATERPNYQEVAADLSVEQMLSGLLRHTVPRNV